MSNLTLFVVQWGLTSLSLWVASYIFSGLRFADGGSLLIAALLLGFANATVFTGFEIPCSVPAVIVGCRSGIIFSTMSQFSMGKLEPHINIFIKCRSCVVRSNGA